MRLNVRLLTFFATLAFALVETSHGQAPQAENAARIIVVPDVHGAYAELTELLAATNVIDADLNWSGRETRLVSLGDLLDRGGDSRLVMDLFMRLQEQASASGGAVHVVLGNHEVMNLIGDLRYVSAGEYAAFADEESEQDRNAAFAAFVASVPDLTEEAARTEFERRYPAGYFGHRRAFAADGRYGAWLLSLPAVLVIDRTAFVHGGLSELVAHEGLEEINRRAQESLRRYLSVRAELAELGVLPSVDMQRDVEIASAVLRDLDDDTEPARTRALIGEFVALSDAPELGIDGPLWYRGSVYCNPFIEEPVLEAALDNIDAERAVVGHTPSGNRRARALYDGRLVMADTGMLTASYQGRPAALVIEGGQISVQYLAPEESLPLEHDGIESDGLTEAQILDALAHGAIEASASAPAGAGAAPLVRVRHEDHVIRARFYSENANAAALELAAHDLDRLLGLNLVPPTVARSHAGDMGALQLVYDDAITEAERLERNASLEAWCSIEAQLPLVYVFDALIYNVGRGPNNFVYRRESAVVKLVDHGRAFGTATAVQPTAATYITPAIRAALGSLDRRGLESALSRWLDERQIRAVLERRDALLEQ